MDELILARLRRQANDKDPLKAELAEALISMLELGLIEASMQDGEMFFRAVDADRGPTLH